MPTLEATLADRNFTIRAREEAPESRNRPVVAILGVSYSTGNMGVDALLSGTIESIHQADPGSEIVLLDYHKTPLVHQVPVGGGTRSVRLINLRFSWKLLLPNNVFRLLAVACLARVLPVASWRRWVIRCNPVLSGIESLSMAASLAGGDSFSDIYGWRRLIYVLLPQCLVLAMGRPLILLPQTYGPFKSPIARLLARRLLKRAAVIYSRDAEGLETTAKLLADGGAGAVFSHDMAFALEPRRPEGGLPSWMTRRAEDSPIVGFNISGLLDIGGYTTNNMFGLGLDYRRLVERLVVWFVDHSNASIVLVSHVCAQGHAEDDRVACSRVEKTLDGRMRDRVHVAPSDYDHREVKYLIGHCDFFLGSRMHACIAAISQGIPTIGLAYSGKFAGVFRSVGLEDCVIDLRNQDEVGVVGRVGEVFRTRSALRENMRQPVRAAKLAAQRLFQEPAIAGLRVWSHHHHCPSPAPPAAIHHLAGSGRTRKGS